MNEIFYCLHDDDFVDKLFQFSTKKRYGHILVGFPNEKVRTVLQHINVFDFFSYTLIPEKIEKEVYDEIYDFFVFSPMSVAYLTWVGSLVMKPEKKAETVIINQRERYDIKTKCDGCNLLVKGCSSLVPFVHSFHPEIEFNENRIKKMCSIINEFSLKIAKDITEELDVKGFNSFNRARQSLGINSHYWLDPFGIYSRGNDLSSSYLLTYKALSEYIGG